MTVVRTSVTQPLRTYLGSGFGMNHADELDLNDALALVPVLLHLNLGRV